MRILVTGGAGFVASHITDHLIRAGHSVIVIDNMCTGKIENVNTNAELVHDDVGTCSLPDHDAIIHAAAYADLRRNWNDVGERHRVYEENVDVTRALLERTEKPFIFVSTASVYGSAMPRPLLSGDGDRIGTIKYEHATKEHEATPATCESPYAASKMACEAMIASYAFKRGNPWKIGRLVNVVGARTAHGVIGDFVRMYRETGKIHAADNGKQHKSWVNVHDVADAFVRMLDMDVPNGIYSITSKERVSWWDIVHEMGVPIDCVTFEDRAGGAVGDPVDLHVSGEKLAPWYECGRSIQAGIQEALAHLGWKGP